MVGFLMLLSALLTLPAATHPDVKLLTSKLEARYRTARTLQSTFLERYLENGQLSRSEAGVAYFRRPGKMRWEYESPEKDLFLVDGKTAWFYVPADHTVTRAPAKESTDWRTPLALLAGEMKLSRVCARVDLAITEVPQNPSDVVLDCHVRGGETPKTGKGGAPAVKNGDLQGAAAEESVYLEVAPETGELARVLVREKGGISIEFNFRNWRFDPPLPDSFFRFDVPRGVAIVNGEAPENSSP
jgi:outer membrane lipoprotein carrier protein